MSTKERTVTERHWFTRALTLVGYLWMAMLVNVVQAEPALLLTGPINDPQRGLADQLAKQLRTPLDPVVELTATPGPTAILQGFNDLSQAGQRLQLAILPADLGQSYLFAIESNPAAAAWLAPLRVVAPLEQNYLYFITRADSGLRTLQALRDARVNVGPIDGATALSVSTLYRMLFDATPRLDRFFNLPDDQALARMLTQGDIDVVAIRAQPPAALLSNMTPDAKRFVRLLHFDAAVSPPLHDVYTPVTLTQSEYPNVLDHDMTTLSVGTYLVAHGTYGQEDQDRLQQYAMAYCRALPLLQESGPSGSSRLAAGLPTLSPGWHYAEASKKELALCFGLAADSIPDNCLPLEQSHGLCGRDQ